jgi:UDP-N-acetylmuramoyl-tripeptide--D-alanyl-D-alanine ligase
LQTEQLYQLYLKHHVISTDTRKIAPGSLFFALKGDKFDANKFAQQAIEAGAAYAIIDDPAYKADERYIVVKDAFIALQDLAKHHRQQLTIPVIGLTGTNGKTTTKELISAVLSQHFKTQFTQGNLNNHIGVPLTILTIDASHEIAVIEMGANHQKEIAFLCTIAQPTHGLITNVGKAHLEGFGGVEGVKKGKGELYDYLSRKAGKTESPKDGRGVAFINNDNSTLKEMQLARGLENVIYYGTRGGENLVTGELLENSPYLTIQWTNNSRPDRDAMHRVSTAVKTQLTGAYNLDNILAAICIGVYFGLTDDEINRGIAGYQPKNNRSQIVQTATNTLICDYYNANPSSMVVAIENMDKLSASRKVLILGDMFELGDEAAAEHEAIIRKALDVSVDVRLFIGEEFYSLSPKVRKSESPEDVPEQPLLELSPTNRDAANAKNTPGLVGDNSNKGEGHPIFYKTAEDAIAALKANPIKNSTILIKGSRGMALERLVELF